MIPAYLLPHTVVRTREIQLDAWGAVTSQSVTIPQVRIEPQTGRQWGLTADSTELKARLFCNGELFKPGDRVTFGDETYTVKDVRKYYGFEGHEPHHIECDLI
jgi:hypothetical protein